MTQPAIQLYTLRDVDESLPEIIERVADAGFKGVEFAYRYRDADPDTVAATLAETGVEPIGAHIDLQDLEQNLDEHIEHYDKIDCRTFVIPHLPITQFRMENRVLELADRLNAVGEALNDQGFQLLYHNQDHDFLPLSGRTPLSRFFLHDISEQPLSPFGFERRIRKIADRATVLGGALDDRVSPLFQQYLDGDSAPLIGGTAFGRLVQATDPEYVSFEVDVGGIVAAGYEPTEVLRRLNERAPYVHMKDVAVKRAMPGTGQISVEPGTGNVDFERVATVAREVGAEWLVYEHDDPADPLLSLENGARSVVPLASGRAEQSRASN